MSWVLRSVKMFSDVLRICNSENALRNHIELIQQIELTNELRCFESLGQLAFEQVPSDFRTCKTLDHDFHRGNFRYLQRVSLWECLPHISLQMRSMSQTPNAKHHQTSSNSQSHFGVTLLVAKVAVAMRPRHLGRWRKWSFQSALACDVPRGHSTVGIWTGCLWSFPCPKKGNKGSKWPIS